MPPCIKTPIPVFILDKRVEGRRERPLEPLVPHQQHEALRLVPLALRRRDIILQSHTGSVGLGVEDQWVGEALSEEAHTIP